jgi:hypothetical protein
MRKLTKAATFFQAFQIQLVASGELKKRKLLGEKQKTGT